jgi:dihydrofolate reductase
MRRLIVSQNTTVDGFMAGPACELDWHFRHWNSDIGDALTAELYKADCLLLGRVTYCGMMQHWTNIAGRLTIPTADMGFFTRVADCPKVVCSNTLMKAAWKNSTLMKGSLEKGLRNLKASKGKNIMVYGSGQLVSLLMQLDLVDEFQLWQHPVLLGSGKPLFTNAASQMQLIKSKVFSTGVVLLCYQCIPGSSRV